MKRLRRALTYDSIGWWFTPLWAWRWYRRGGLIALSTAWYWATNDH